MTSLHQKDVIFYAINELSIYTLNTYLKRI
jgi:hypothetical protein